MRKKAAGIIAAFILVAIIAELLVSKYALHVQRYDLAYDNLPASFDGYRIAQISDLHNAVFGKNNSELLEVTAKENPDIIVFTGDLIDDETENPDEIAALLKKFSEIAPCFYVTGNHEAEIYREYFAFEKSIRSYIKTLHTESYKIEKNGEKIYIAGIDDPVFNPQFDEDLAKLGEKKGFTVLLSHRPEYFPQYAEYGFETVLTGHTHGGQIRLPFIGAILTPSQGLFPEYDSGLYSEGNTNMIISKGLGTSVIPIRFHNMPEVVLVQLKVK